MEIPEWSKQCELQRNRMKRILCLEDSTNARTLSYLDPMSLLELRSACKELKSRVEQYDGWSFILIELFLPNLRIMEPFDEVSISSSDLLPPDNPQCLKLTSIKNKRHQLWFSYFNSAASLLGDCFTGSELSDPIQLLSKNLLRELKTMDAPNMTLMKSNPLVRTSSSFQLFLLDRLRQNSQPEDDSDQCGLGLGGLSDPVDDEAVWQIEDWLEQNEKDYEKMEAEEDKQTLLKIRWYLQDSAIGDIFDITEIDDLVPIEKRKSVGNTDTDITMSLTYSNVQGKELGNPYLSIFLHIIKVVRWYCKVVKLTVSNQVSSNAKLRLYSELQKRFTYVCEAFSKNYSFLEKSLNKVFKDNYPNHPVFPCFSFWRCFMRIWITDVHAAVEDELNEECLRILLRARQQHLVKCLSEADFSIAEDAAQDCQKRNPFSNSQSDLDLITVQGFLSALADISLHEASIHYMSHTRVIQGESPYLKFEDLFIHQSVSFCLAHFDLLSRNIKVFDKFLEIESSLMSQVCLNRTYSRYYDSVGVSFLRNIEEEIETIAQDGGKSNEKTIRESSAEDIKRIEMLSDIISFNKCPESKRPYETQCFDEIMCQRASSVSMEECREIANSMWGCSSPELLHVIDLYGFIESKLKGVTSKFRSNDEAVIAHNEEYGVPFDLGGAEALISLFTKLSENLLQDLIASVQPQASDDGDQFEVVSANVSYETYNELSEEEQLTDEHILIGIERTV